MAQPLNSGSYDIFGAHLLCLKILTKISYENIFFKKITPVNPLSVTSGKSTDPRANGASLCMFVLESKGLTCPSFFTLHSTFIRSANGLSIIYSFNKHLLKDCLLYASYQDQRYKVWSFLQGSVQFGPSVVSDSVTPWTSAH